MRAYARSADKTVYGPAVTYTSQGCKDKPAILDFNPKQGVIGDQIVITGNFFSARKDATTVRIGDVAMEIKEVSEHQIVVQIPYLGSAGPNAVKLVANGNETLAVDTFIFGN
jgi:hypothetical protein